MNYIGLDPSFTSTGIAIIDTENRTIDLFSVGQPIGDKSFSNIVTSVDIQVSRIMNSLPEKGEVITETPPASGNFSSGLYALDTHLVLTLVNYYKVQGVAPTYLGHLHRTRKYKKSDSVILAKKFLDVFIKHGYSDIHKGRISSDAAEAFIFVTRLFVSINTVAIIKDLMEVCPWIIDKKEFIL